MGKLRHRGGLCHSLRKPLPPGLCLPCDIQDRGGGEVAAHSSGSAQPGSWGGGEGSMRRWGKTPGRAGSTARQEVLCLSVTGASLRAWPSGQLGALSTGERQPLRLGLKAGRRGVGAGSSCHPGSAPAGRDAGGPAQVPPFTSDLGQGSSAGLRPWGVPGWHLPVGSPWNLVPLPQCSLPDTSSCVAWQCSYVGAR